MRVVVSTLLLVLASACAYAQSADHYPSRPIRVLAAGPAGGPIDIMARIVGQKLTEAMGQAVIIDNRGGGGGTIGTRIAATGNPDGYTLLCNSSQFAVSARLYSKPGYDPFKDFATVINAGVSPNIITAHPSMPPNNLKELIAWAKSNKLSYGSAGTGTTPHLTGERLLKTMVGLPVVHVPYSGAAPAINAVTANQVPIALTAMPPAVQLIKSGKLKGIAVTSPQRMPSLPDVVTVAESGFPGYEDYTWIAFFAPAATPKAIVVKLNHEIAAAIAKPDAHERLAVLGFDPIQNTPEQFAAYLKVEVEKWGKVIQDAGARVD
jgi:tripartite-type tricarboxylate transporter receptor subunit TctC